MLRGIGPTEILIVLGIVLLLFGGRKLPELARGTGRALRIFKSEVKAIEPDPATDSDVADGEIVDGPPTEEPDTGASRETA